MFDTKSDPDEGSQRSNDPPADDIRVQVDRILRSPGFAQSYRLQKFLKFIVEETLAGRAAGLKEYTIAFEVFERDESFDPQTSSIVRVEASRMRAKLKEYYGINGRNDPVHISLPPGSYVPTFQTATQDIEPGRTRLAIGGIRRFTPTRAAVVALVLAVIFGASVPLLFDVAYFTPDRDTSPAARNPGRTYSIAVLPLRNLSGKPDQDYFSDGMTNALVTSLAKQEGVRVISLTSAMAYKNVSRPIADIARELNVDHVIEGAVLRDGNRIRISAQLIEAATDRHLWAESYVRDVADVLAIQDDVARRVVAALSGKVAAVPDVGLKSAPAVDPAAQEAYLKGLYFRNKMTEAGFRKGIAYFEQAVERAPEYAAAYSGMAACYCLLGGHGFELVEPSTGMPAAKAAVLESLRLDDSLAEAHAFLGIIRLKYEWDWPGAEKAFKRSIRLNPSYAQARLFYSFFLEAMGRQAEAIRAAEEAKAIDPLSLAANVNLGWQYLQAGRPEQARQILESTAELDADFWGVYWGLGHYYRNRGKHDEAIAAFQTAIDAGGGHVLPLTALGYTYAISGKPGKARKILDRLKALAEESYVSPFNMATIHVGLGEDDDAFVWLEKGFEARSRSMVWLKVAREYDGLRADPRFKSLLQRIGLPE